MRRMAYRLHLVRHGEVANPDHIVYASLAGFGLSPRGRRQAEATAARLTTRPVSAVWSSPLDRARETADLIAAHFDLAVLVDPDLTEWGLADRWAGIRWEDLRTVFPGELEAYLDHPTNLSFAPESLAELATRVAAAAERAANAGDGDVVVVSHQDPIQAARLALTGRPLNELWVNKPLHAAVVTLERRWREVETWAPEEQAAVGTPPTLADLDTAEAASHGSASPNEIEELAVGGEGKLG